MHEIVSARFALAFALFAAGVAVAQDASARESLPARSGLDESRLGYVHGFWANDRHSVWSQQLELSPEWRPVDWLSLGARLNIGHDVANVGSFPVELSKDAYWSDLLLTVASPGVTVPTIGIRAGGGVHVLLPTSLDSQRSSLLAGAGPEVELGRDFPVLQGLTLRYAARFVFTFYKYAEGPGDYYSPGPRNSWAVLAHGPALELKPIRSLRLSATILSMSSFWRGPTPSPYDPEASPGFIERSAVWFSVSADYRVVEALSVEVGVGNDVFAVLPEAAHFAVRHRPTVVFLRLSLRPAAIFD